jgi:c-di-GMP-binding flagellar brake protein YcgR
MEERRKYVRLNVPLEVKYSVEGKAHPAGKSITKNISPSGTRFAIEEQLAKGTIINLEVKIPLQTEPILLKSRVVWSKKDSVEGPKPYDVGLEFVQIPEESKSIFFQYLCNLMYDQLKRI